MLTSMLLVAVLLACGGKRVPPAQAGGEETEDPEDEPKPTDEEPVPEPGQEMPGPDMPRPPRP